MSERIAILTGTSSGIGEALAGELLGRGWGVVGISRRPSDLKGRGYTHVSLDLSDVAGLTSRIDRAVGNLVAAPEVTRAGLVNNAADVALLGPLEQADPEQMLRAYAINVIAPVALMGWLLRSTRHDAAVRIVNVSTGAASRAVPGLGTYGGTKAALRMAGMAFATELDVPTRSGGPRPDATVLSYNPGPVDTAMQAATRSSSPDVLPVVEMFQRFQAEGMLAPPEQPAGEIADYLESDGNQRFEERQLGG